MKNFSLLSRLKSFGYAFDGIKQMFLTEHNTWIHAVATIVVIVLCFICKVSALEMIALVFAIAFVWMAEMFNTAIEKLCDYMSVKKNKEIKFIKDVSAAAVLVASIAALLTGLLIFIPKIF